MVITTDQLLWRQKTYFRGIYPHRKEKEMNFLTVIMTSGTARWRVRTTATATTTESRNMAAILQIIGWQTCSLGLQCTSLILDIRVMINWHLSKQGVRWPVSRGYIAGSSLQLIEAADQVLVFDWIAGSRQVNLLKTGQEFCEAG